MGQRAAYNLLLLKKGSAMSDHWGTMDSSPNHPQHQHQHRNRNADEIHAYRAVLRRAYAECWDLVLRGSFMRTYIEGLPGAGHAVLG